MWYNKPMWFSLKLLWFSPSMYMYVMKILHSLKVYTLIEWLLTYCVPLPESCRSGIKDLVRIIWYARLRPFAWTQHSARLCVISWTRLCSFPEVMLQAFLQNKLKLCDHFGAIYANRLWNCKVGRWGRWMHVTYSAKVRQITFMQVWKDLSFYWKQGDLKYELIRKLT